MLASANYYFLHEELRLFVCSQPPKKLHIEPLNGLGGINEVKLKLRWSTCQANGNKRQIFITLYQLKLATAAVLCKTHSKIF